jgi:hypothetical protein
LFSRVSAAAPLSREVCEVRERRLFDREWREVENNEKRRKARKNGARIRVVWLVATNDVAREPIAARGKMIT